MKSSLSKLAAQPLPNRRPTLTRMLELLPEIEQIHAAGWAWESIYQHLMAHRDFGERRFSYRRFRELVALARARQVQQQTAAAKPVVAPVPAIPVAAPVPVAASAPVAAPAPVAPAPAPVVVPAPATPVVAATPSRAAVPVATQASAANQQASAATQALANQQASAATQASAEPQAPIPVAQQFSIEELMELARPFRGVPQVPIPQPIETPRLTGEQGRLRKIELGEHVTTVEEMLDNSMRLLSVPPCPPEQSRAVAQAMIDQHLQDIANTSGGSQRPPFLYELAIFFYAHFVRDYDRSHDPLIGFRDAGDVWEPMMIEFLKRRPPYGDAVELWALRRLRLPDEEKAKLTMTSFVRYVSGLIRDIITDAVRRRRAQLEAKPA